MSEPAPYEGPSEAHRIAYDDSMTIDERREALDKLYDVDPGGVAGYLSMLHMMEDADNYDEYGQRVEPINADDVPLGSKLRNAVGPIRVKLREQDER